jgi:dTMP kinase
MKKGLFITFEGIEGSGKSTQARLLYEYLLRKKIQAVLTAEPGGTVLGQRIREVLLSPEHKGMAPVTELLLYNASRSQLVNELIKPAIKKGMVIISDRFSDSTIAYQGYGRGIPLKTLSALDKIATGGLKPDLTILLDLPPEKGLARNKKDKKKFADRLELEELEFHKRVREGFLRIRKKEPARVKLIDVSRGGVREIHKKITLIIENFFKIPESTAQGLSRRIPDKPERKH